MIGRGKRIGVYILPRLNSTDEMPSSISCVFGTDLMIWLRKIPRTASLIVQSALDNYQIDVDGASIQTL